MGRCGLMRRRLVVVLLVVTMRKFKLCKWMRILKRLFIVMHCRFYGMVLKWIEISTGHRMRIKCRTIYRWILAMGPMRYCFRCRVDLCQASCVSLIIEGKAIMMRVKSHFIACNRRVWDQDSGTTWLSRIWKATTITIVKKTIATATTRINKFEIKLVVTSLKELI